jgi:hypothetical protein
MFDVDRFTSILPYHHGQRDHVERTLLASVLEINEPHCCLVFFMALNNLSLISHQTEASDDSSTEVF